MYDILHTDSSYGDSFHLDEYNKQNISELIHALEAQEREVYSKYGVSSIEELLEKIRKIFSELSKDQASFQAFKNVNVNRILTPILGAIPKKNMSSISEIKIFLKNKELTQDVRGALEKLNQSGNLIGGGSEELSGKVSGEINIDLRFGLNPELISQLKIIVNDLAGTKLKKESTATEYLYNAIQKLANQNGDKIIELNSGLDQITQETDFQYGIEDLRKVHDDSSLIDTYITQPLNKMNALVKDICGYNTASPYFRIAYDRTWEKNIQPALSSNLDELIAKGAFFIKGAALNYYVGALGEFQAALLNNYLLAYRNKGDIPKELESEISITVSEGGKSGGEQNKRDVTILGNIGIQVKNINTYASEDLEFNQHPAAYVGLPNFPNGDAFCDFLANYFFNESYRYSHNSDYQSIIENLPSYFIQNLRLQTMLDFDDSNLFYLIGGEYLVPASVLAKAQFGDDGKGKVDNFSTTEITGPDPIASDDEFRMSNDKAHDGRHSLGFYWKNPRNNWVPKDANSSLYNKLIGKDISIRVRFKQRAVSTNYSLYR